MNTVTFETALALKDAGFPQPEPSFGQVWVSPLETIILGGMSKARPKARLAVSKGASDLIFTDEWIKENLVFAPTATDILEQLPDFYYVRKGTYDNLPIFSVFDEKEVNCSDIAILAKAFGKNPHEAAAKAFLELKKAEK